MSSLGRLMRDYVESRLGKIHWYRICAVLVENLSSRKKRLVRWDHKPWEDIIDLHGRLYTFTKGRSAACKNVDLWIGKYPHKAEGRITVLAADCKACEFHEKPRNGRRFACCRWAREHNNSPSPADLMAKAVADADKIFKGACL